MSELLKLQGEFTKAVSKLLMIAYEDNDLVTLGEVYRTDEQAEINALGSVGRTELVNYLEEEPSHAWYSLALAIDNNRGSGIRRSLHGLALAIDIKLFKWNEVGKLYTYLTDSNEYRTLGEWWEGQHPLARWGGRFSKPDGGHFSFEWKGIR